MDAEPKELSKDLLTSLSNAVVASGMAFVRPLGGLSEITLDAAVVHPLLRLLEARGE